MTVLVCYDIADDRRRARAAKALLAFGYRIQESVYRCELDGAKMRRLQRWLMRVLDPATDRARMERIPEKPIWTLGPSEPERTTEWVF